MAQQHAEFSGFALQSARVASYHQRISTFHQLWAVQVVVLERMGRISREPVVFVAGGVCHFFGACENVECTAQDVEIDLDFFGMYLDSRRHIIHPVFCKNRDGTCPGNVLYVVVSFCDLQRSINMPPEPKETGINALRFCSIKELITWRDKTLSQPPTRGLNNII